MVNLRIDQALNTVAQTVEDQGGNSSVLALSSTAVGIGTSSPAELLQVAGNVRLERNGSPKLSIRSRGSGSQHYSLRATNDADAAGGARFAIRNEGQDRDDLVLDSAGNIQIPGNVRLERNGSPKLSIRSRGNGTQHYSLRATNDADAAGGARFAIRNENQDRDDLMLDSAGNIQISGDIQIAGDVRLSRRLFGGLAQIFQLSVSQALTFGTTVMRVGAKLAPGRIDIIDRNDRQAITLSSSSDGGAALTVGAIESEGNITVVDGTGEKVLTFDGGSATLAVGPTVPGLGARDGDIVVNDRDGVRRIHLDGNSGDISLMGADLAEDFETATPVEPGSVLVSVGPDEVAPATEALDRRVIGVASGAGGWRAGLRLGARPGERRVPVALVGRVYCQADAGHGAIAAGDLLTTSPTVGHAMRVDDPAAAVGAILGKALAPLLGGTGLIPVLLTHQ
ncbi:hypothetical protein ACFVJ5_30510 [Nocardia sp. NPDC127606]|uniref:hypothetical protein n=1 Tax=Nocardia sp. NPDC127606 TaxID=3345406 RepID=UPI0036335F5D